MNSESPEVAGEEAHSPPKRDGAAMLAIAVLLGAVAVDVLGFFVGLTASTPDHEAVVRGRMGWVQVLPALAGPLLVLGAYKLTSDRQRGGMSRWIIWATRSATVLLAGTLVAYLLARLLYDRTMGFLVVSFLRRMTNILCFVLLLAVSSGLFRRAGARHSARVSIALAIAHPIVAFGAPVLDAVLSGDLLWTITSPLADLGLWTSTAALFWRLRSNIRPSGPKQSTRSDAPLLPQYQAPIQRDGEGTL